MVMSHTDLVAIVRHVPERRNPSFSLNRTVRSSHGTELFLPLGGSSFVEYRGLFGLFYARWRAQITILSRSRVVQPSPLLRAVSDFILDLSSSLREIRWEAQCCGIFFLT